MIKTIKGTLIFVSSFLIFVSSPLAFFMILGVRKKIRSEEKKGEDKK